MQVKILFKFELPELFCDSKVTKMVISEEIKLLLEVQQKAYHDSVKMLVSSINERMKHQEDKINDLVVSLQFSQKELDDLKSVNAVQKEEILQLKKDKASLKIREIENAIEKINNRQDYQEDYSRRNNIRIEGVAEDYKETWEGVKVKVQRILSETMKMDRVELERVHRVGDRSRRENGDVASPRTIVARFRNFDDRQQALRNAHMLKNTDIFFNEDLCEASMKIRKDQLPELKRARTAGKIAYFNHTKLVIRDRREDQQNTNVGGRARGREDRGIQRASTDERRPVDGSGRHEEGEVMRVAHPPGESAVLNPGSDETSQPEPGDSDVGGIQLRSSTSGAAGRNDLSEVAQGDSGAPNANQSVKQKKNKKKN